MRTAVPHYDSTPYTVCLERSLKLRADSGYDIVQTKIEKAGWGCGEREQIGVTVGSGGKPVGDRNPSPFEVFNQYSIVFFSCIGGFRCALPTLRDSADEWNGPVLSPRSGRHPVTESLSRNADTPVSLPSFSASPRQIPLRVSRSGEQTSRFQGRR